MTMMDRRTQKGRSRTGARCDLALVFAAIVIVGLSGAAGQIYTVNSPWFELSIGPDVGTHFNLTFFNALGNSSLSNKVVSLSYAKIVELDPTGKVVVDTGPNDPAVWAFSTGNISSPQNPHIPFVLARGKCSNNATVEIAYYEFPNPENISFAGEVIVLYTGSIKFSVNITNWYHILKDNVILWNSQNPRPFQFPNHSVQLWVQGNFINVTPNPSAIVKDSRGSVTQVGIGSQYPSAPPFVVNFAQAYEADGVAIPIFIDDVLESISPIIVDLTFLFNTSAKEIFYDPDIGVLFEPVGPGGSGTGSGGGGDGTNTLAIEIAVPVSVAFVVVVAAMVLVAGLVYFYFRKRKAMSQITEKMQTWGGGNQA